MKILLHSSKTMKSEVSTLHTLSMPQFISQANYLNDMLHDTDDATLLHLMGISQDVAKTVRLQIDQWCSESEGSAAALTFRGDIYSGLAAAQWDKADAIFAQQNLLILSGLYGILRPFDEIKPYRLEMGYRFRLDGDLSITKFWQQQLTGQLDPSETYINLTAKEYFKVIEHQLRDSVVISPKFLTMNNKTHQPVFVTVHAKIARGSLANWIIKNKITDPQQIITYDLLNYTYDAALSTPTEPVFVCQKFEGLGMSVRLK